MERLVQWSNEAFAERKLHPLLITAVFVVEFLAIHPFQDGNGRISRVLTTYLLLKSNYAYVPYSSLEAVVEQSKEGYYLSLWQTQGTLKLPELSLQILELVKSRGRITVKDIVTITNANRNTIKKHLESLVEKNYLRQNGTGKGTWYSTI